MTSLYIPSYRGAVPVCLRQSPSDQSLAEDGGRGQSGGAGALQLARVQHLPELHGARGAGAGEAPRHRPHGEHCKRFLKLLGF